MNILYCLQGVEFEWDSNKSQSNFEKHSVTYMNNPEEELNLQLRPRSKETISLDIPKDTLESLKKVAVSRDMSLEGLLK